MAANPGTVPLWASIDIVDDYTIKLNLKSFQNTILNRLESTGRFYGLTDGRPEER